MNVLSLPAIFSLELTAACNNRCIGCSNVYSENRAQGLMTAAQWERLLATFAPDAVQIRLTGGEPSLHPEFFRILAAATSYDAKVTVFTNGRWRHALEFVHRLHGWPHLKGLLISLHGARPASHEIFSGVDGSFTETVTNIRLAVSNGIKVAISTILTCQSIKEIDEIIQLGHELGVSHIAFNRYLGPPLPGIEPTVEEYQRAIRKLEALIRDGALVRYGIGVPQCFMQNDSFGCLAGVAYAAIDPWGQFRPCAHSSTIIGSLHKSTLGELWLGPKMDTWRNRMPSECLGCQAFSTCHGGCRAMSELHPEHRDPLRCSPLKEYMPTLPERILPANGIPRFIARTRQESFGYALLGNGQVLPIRAEAISIIEAIDGKATFIELQQQFGQSGLNFLGELWSAGLILIEQ